MSLSAEQWKRLTALFDRVLSLPEPERGAFIEAETADLPALRRELESLLRSHDAADDFLEASSAPMLAQALSSQVCPKTLGVDEKIGDFVVLRKLGEGSFACVYLAHQLSLNRKVALKVSGNFGEEARNMAHLEHDNIVKVFSETVEATRGIRLLCMQFIAGPSLAEVLSEIKHRRREKITGANILEIIDSRETVESAFNPAALKDRELLSGMDGMEAAIWMGIRLADALAYAHERGVLHLDVKPANILLSPYGRPMLTDFNVSLDRRNGKSPKMVGGTKTYMAPEQQALFELANPDDAIAAIDRRADVYALGVVIREMIEVMGGGARDLAARFPELHHVLERATESEPGRRFDSASELASALEGCRELREIAKCLPPPGFIARLTTERPWLGIGFFSILPQVLGSIINISYNSMQIVSRLTPAQQAKFECLLIPYNLVLYPLCIWLLVRQLRPLVARLQRRQEGGSGRRGATAALRKRALMTPLMIAVCTTLGWMPGSIFFPLFIHLSAGPIAPGVFGHFFVSFTLSWLIALAYSFLYMQYVAARVFYPSLCEARAGVRGEARDELRPIGPGMRFVHFAAGFVPLIGAGIVIAVGPESLDVAHYNPFRMLVAFLIVIGMTGLVFALRATGLISQTILALTGGEPAKR